MLGFIIHAGDTLPCETVGSTGGCAVPIRGFNVLFTNVLGVIVPFAAVALFIMIPAGGFQYITSGGNPKATESAKNTLTYAILGMILVGAAFLILQLIENFTGAPVTEFNVVQ